MKTIKERALELLRQFPLQYLAPVKLHEVCNELESVLKTLAYAPEPEPVAWRYEDAFGTHFTEDYSEISNIPGVLLKGGA